MISVVIPVYKNVSQFVENLHINIKFLGGCEIIIVNDYPEVSIKDQLRSFENITLIEHLKNLGFGATVNDGVKHASGEHLLLLNTDVILKDDSYKKALSYFSDKNTFAVSFAQKELSGEIVGRNRIYWRHGFIYHERGNSTEKGYNGWAEGGSCLIDKNKFNELGGFDPIYKPFYWEDIDLSYNAWKSGYKVFYDPSIEVIHHHESTIGKYFQEKKVRTISYRNQFMFIWKNIGSPRLWLQYLLWKGINAAVLLRHGEPNFILAHIQAFGKLPGVITSRLQIRKHWKLSDEEILGFFKS